MNNPSKSSPESPAKEQPGEVAAMVKRLEELQSAWLPGIGECFPITLTPAERMTLIEKLGQGWIPAEWQELGGVPGPENEPAALVAWISVAQKEGVEVLFRRMQKRLLLWEREKLSPETYEKIKDWPIYTEPPPPERP